MFLAGLSGGDLFFPAGSLGFDDFRGGIGNKLEAKGLVPVTFYLILSL